MTTQEVDAAQRVLRSLSNITGRFARVRIAGGEVTVLVERVLHRKPRSKGNLYWASDSGRYRDVWVLAGRNGEEKLFRVYFGPWAGRGTRSAYVVVFRHGNPRLEVRVSAIPKGGRAILVHKLAFTGRRNSDPETLRNRALGLARRGRIPVMRREAVLGSYDPEKARLKPKPREVFHRILTCALIKSSIIETVLRRPHPPRESASRSGTTTPAREQFPKGRRARIDVFLDQRFEAHGRHNRLINRLKERLEAHGYRVDRAKPYDLVARKGSQMVIVEVKAWQPKQLLDSLKAAAGQLLYYSHLLKKQTGKAPKLIAAVPVVPPADLVTFVERTARIGLVWSRSSRVFAGGTMARTIFPDLLRRA